MATAIQGAFVGGILDTGLSARVDLAKYVAGCRELENFIVQAHGGVARRPGTEFIVGISGEGAPRLIPFQFNVEQAYVLVFTDEKMYVCKWDSGTGAAGLVEDPGSPGDPYTVTSPYATEDVFGIAYAQSADTMYLCHPDYPPYKLTRADHDDWTLEEVVFGTAVPTPPAGTATWGGTAGSTTIRYKVAMAAEDGDVSLASDAFQLTNGQPPAEWVAGNHVDIALAGGYITSITKADPAVVTVTAHGLLTGDTVYISAVKRMTDLNGRAFTVTKLTADTFSLDGEDSSGYTAFTGTITAATQANPVKITSAAHGLTTGDRVVISGVAGMTELNGNTYTITKVDNNSFSLGVDGTGYTAYTSGGSFYAVGGYITPYAAEYLIYKERDGYYGFIGSTPSPWFIDYNYTPDMNDTPPEDYQPFETEYPSCVAFHEQRLWYGGTLLHPQTIYASRVGLFDNFNKSRPQLDDDSLEFTLSSTQVNALRWLAPFGDLLLGTQGAEWKVAPVGGDGALTPSTTNAKTQSYWGSAPNLQPIVIGNSVLHVQHKSGKLRDLFYSLEKDGYQGNDLSVLAASLFDGIEVVSWAYQGAPDSVVWVVLSDGTMLGLTYLKEHQVWAWSKHTTDGTICSVACIPGDKYDDLYLSVLRGSTYFIERMADKWTKAAVENANYLDASVTKTSGTAFTTVDGLDHLEGETVSALVDGGPVEGLVVASGEVTLPYEAEKAIVGLPFTSKLRTMSVELNGGATIGKIKSITQVVARFKRTVGGKIGPTVARADALRFTSETYGVAIEPEDVLDYTFVFPAGFDRDGSIYVIQDQPLPMTLLGLMLDVAVEED